MILSEFRFRRKESLSPVNAHRQTNEVNTVLGDPEQGKGTEEEVSVWK